MVGIDPETQELGLQAERVLLKIGTPPSFRQRTLFPEAAPEAGTLISSRKDRRTEKTVINKVLARDPQHPRTRAGPLLRQDFDGGDRHRPGERTSRPGRVAEGNEPRRPLRRRRGGGKIQEWFGYTPAFQLRAQDFGELTVLAVAGLGLAVLVGGAYLLSGPEMRRISLRLAALAALLVFFGVVVDMLHVVRAWPLLGLVEDGGEMLAMSLACWYVFGLFARTPAARG